MTPAPPRTFCRATWNGSARRPVSKQVRRRRIVAAVALPRRRRGRRRRVGCCRPPAPRGRPAPPPTAAAAEAVPDRLSGGLHARADGRAREGGREDRRRRAPRPRAAERVRLPRRDSRSGRVPCFGRQLQTNLEGFLFPATYDFLRGTTSKQLVAGPDPDVLPQLAEDRPVVCALEEPDALRRAEDRLDGRDGRPSVPSERPLVAAVIYNRLHDHMQLGIDATLRYGLHIPPTQVDHAVGARELEPVQHAPALRAAADADREPRARLAPGSRAPGEGRLPLLRAQARPQAPLLHRERLRVRRLPRGARVRVTTSTSRCSGIRWRTRSRRGCRTPPSTRPGSTGATWRSTSRIRSRPSSALRTLGFAGANVTIPHKAAVVAACDEADGEAVNTLVFRDGRVLGFNTDKEILAGHPRHARLPDRRRRRCADARAGAAGRHPRLLAARRRGRRTPPAAT